MTGLMHMWDVPEVRTALIVGTVVAVVTAAVGVLTVLRGQSFAGHALTDLASVGGSAAFLLGVSQLWGFLTASVLAGVAMHAAGAERARGRDVATGVVLGAGMGLTALFLSLATMRPAGGSASVTVLFGSLFALSPATVPLVVILAAVCAVMVIMLWRPAVFVTVAPQLARSHGVHTGIVNALFMCVLAIGVSLGSISVGAVLSTALLIGPASCGLLLARRLRGSVLLAVCIGVLCVWGGIILAYASYGFTGGHAWSVSFCIVALILICYLAARGLARGAGSMRRTGMRDV